MIYYKYRSDSVFTEQIFKSGKVYLSTAEKLNDPFECSLQEIGKEWIEKKIVEMKTSALTGFIMEAKKALDNGLDFFGISEKEIDDIFESIKNQSIDEAYAFYVQFIKEHTGHSPSKFETLFSQLDTQLLSVGIFSMSTQSDHPLMWAHYAGDHSGICLGFKKIPGSRLTDTDHCLPVIYSDQLPELEGDGLNVQMSFSLDTKGLMYTSSFKISFSDKTFQKAITTKPTCWNYEYEWRYIEPHAGLYNWPGELAEITFGLRCKEDRINHYIKLVEEYVSYPVSLFQMQKKRGSNELERKSFAKPITEPKTIAKTQANKGNESNVVSHQDFEAIMERLILEENYGEVLFQVDENLKTNPNSPILWHLKGVAHGYSQEPEEALKSFSKLTQLSPNVAKGWYQMACALIELERHQEAIDSLKKAYVLDPNDASTAFNLGIELLRTENDINEALIYLKLADNLGHRRAYSVISEYENSNS